MLLSLNNLFFFFFLTEVLDGSDGKESTCNAGDLGLILGLGRCPGGGDGNSLEYPCLENFMDRGPWQAEIHRVTESDMTEVT